MKSYPRLIVLSAAKAALKNASGAPTISAEAIDWLEEHARASVALCAETARRSASGRLMAPPEGASTPSSVIVRSPESEPGANGRKIPDRLGASAKEWKAKSPEEKNEHLQNLYVFAPAINRESLDLLHQCVATGCIGGELREKIEAIQSHAAELD